MLQSNANLDRRLILISNDDRLQSVKISKRKNQVPERLGGPSTSLRRPTNVTSNNKVDDQYIQYKDYSNNSQYNDHSNNKRPKYNSCDKKVDHRDQNQKDYRNQSQRRYNDQSNMKSDYHKYDQRNNKSSNQNHGNNKTKSYQSNIRSESKEQHKTDHRQYQSSNRINTLEPERYGRERKDENAQKRETSRESHNSRIEEQELSSQFYSKWRPQNEQSSG